MVIDGLRRLLLVLLIVCVSFVTTGAANFTDLSDNKLFTRTDKWVELGFIHGYPDRTCRPEQPITKAEFIVLVNRAFEFNGEAEVLYQDVSLQAWYAGAIATALGAGYLRPAPQLFPNKLLTRFDIVPLLYRLLNPDPAQKDYLQGAIDLSDTDVDRQQLNTLVKEGIFSLDDLALNEQVTREEALYLIELVLKRKHTGSLLLMDEMGKEMFSLLNLSGNDYYYYQNGALNAFLRGECPPFQGDEMVAKKLWELVALEFKKYIEGNQMGSLPVIWIERQGSHAFFGFKKINEDYLVYRVQRIVKSGEKVWAEPELVLEHDRSDVAKAKVLERQKYEEGLHNQRIRIYLPVMRAYGLYEDDYDIYTLEQKTKLLQSPQQCMPLLSSESALSLQQAFSILEREAYHSGDDPLIYWVKKDDSVIYASVRRYEGVYEVYVIQQSVDDGTWKTELLPTITPDLSSLEMPDIQESVYRPIAEALQIDENDYYFYSRNDFHHKYTVFPQFENQQTIMQNLGFQSGSTLFLQKGAYVPAIWVHKDGQHAYCGTRQGDGSLLALVFERTEERPYWLPRQVLPVYKPISYEPKDVELQVMESLGLEVDKYIYYPFEKRNDFVLGRSGPYVDDLKWGISLDRKMCSAFQIGSISHYDEVLPGVFIKKSGEDVYAVRETYSGVQEAVRFKRDLMYYEDSKHQSRIVPVWGQTNLLPEMTMTDYKPPQLYVSAAERAGIKTTDYLYYPFSKREELWYGCSGPFKQDPLAAMTFTIWADRHVLSIEPSITNQEAGYWIHPNGLEGYAIQQKSSGQMYLCYLKKAYLPEGYVIWEVSENLIKQ